MKAPLSSRHFRRALTLPEILVMLAILAVLVALGATGYQRSIHKAESVDAITKLKNMYAGLHAYLIDKQTWPQEPDEDAEVSDQALWDWWKKEMKPYGVTEQDWFTTSHLRRLNREMKEAGGKAINVEELRQAMEFPSILPGNFEPGPTEPYRYQGQPWVSETGEYHGDDGIYTIMPGGAIHKMMTMGQMNSVRGKSPASKK